MNRAQQVSESKYKPHPSKAELPTTRYHVSLECLIFWPFLSSSRIHRASISLRAEYLDLQADEKSGGSNAESIETDTAELRPAEGFLFFGNIAFAPDLMFQLLSLFSQKNDLQPETRRIGGHAAVQHRRFIPEKWTYPIHPPGRDSPSALVSDTHHPHWVPKVSRCILRSLYCSRLQQAHATAYPRNAGVCLGLPPPLKARASHSSMAEITL